MFLWMASSVFLLTIAGLLPPSVLAFFLIGVGGLTPFFAKATLLAQTWWLASVTILACLTLAICTYLATELFCQIASWSSIQLSSSCSTLQVNYVALLSLFLLIGATVGGFLLAAKQS